ncbi:MAG: RIP metalloprotease RseP [Deltaproteobacteria bacterium]|nr:RIP metalloprotease RseP [Deltaproteobacteria bacterium]MBI4223593.1 RIP metalloprotease RseP [Deltaproteobacteria bacterium]
MITSILAFVVAFGLLVLVHEFGHFWVARRNGVHVEKFSIGFGPKLWGFQWKETAFVVSLLPLGGYVKMKGESDEDEIDPNDRSAFSNKPIARRSRIVVAGPIMNLVLSFVLMPVVFWLGRPDPALLNQPAVLEAVLPGSPAERAGLQAGDTVIKINQEAISGWNVLIREIQLAGNQNIHVTVERKENPIQLTLQPEWDEAQGRYLIGIQGKTIQTPVEFKKYGFVEGLAAGVRTNWENTLLTLRVLQKLVTFQLSYKTLGGPVQIAYTLAQASASGLGDFLYFTAFLSLQLGVLNLLPIPVLDGGHLVFYLIEAIRRKPLSLKARTVAQQVGLVLLITLIVFVTWNDIEKLVR